MTLDHDLEFVTQEGKAGEMAFNLHSFASHSPKEPAS